MGDPVPQEEPSTDQRKVAIESSEVITASADYNCEYIDLIHAHSACAPLFLTSIFGGSDSQTCRRRDTVCTRI